MEKTGERGKIVGEQTKNDLETKTKAKTADVSMRGKNTYQNQIVI